MNTIRLSILWLLLLLFVSPVSADEQANVFVYHRFGDSRYPSTNISLESFAEQLELLRQENYTVLSLGEIVSRLRAGQPLPSRCASITVDDAYRSFLTGAIPLLSHYGYPSTLFVSTDSVGGDEFISWDELRSLKSRGVEIGSHSASHPYLLNRKRGETDEDWRGRIKSDILRASQALKRELGQEPRLFAYPYGEFSAEVVELIRELGFIGAAVQYSGVVSVATNLFELPRFPMGGEYAALEGFREKLAMRPLVVEVIEGEGPIVEQDTNPPELVVDILSGEVDLSQLQCFVQGQQECFLAADPAVPGRYRVRALQPLDSRRSRYTLTAPANRGQGWYWFSQLWILPQR